MTTNAILLLRLGTVIFSLWVAVPFFCSASTVEHEYRQDDRAAEMDKRMDEHLEAASSILAEIETKLNIAIAVGAMLITGLLIPWIRRRVGIGLILFLALNLSSCGIWQFIHDDSKLEVDKEVLICQYGYCRNRCFSNRECHPSCYCNRYGYCINR